MEKLRLPARGGNMTYTVGPKGQVVIAREIREQLHVVSGSIALQSLVEDHVEISFLPPAHRQSLKGSLAKEIRTRVGGGEAWERAREEAWQLATREDSRDVDEGAIRPKTKRG